MHRASQSRDIYSVKHLSNSFGSIEFLDPKQLRLFLQVCQPSLDNSASLFCQTTALVTQQSGILELDIAWG